MKWKMPCLILCCFGLIFAITGCVKKESRTEKLRDLDSTVLSEEKIPEELAEEIEERKAQPFKLTFADKGYLYIAVGYGAQETSGYSIEVKELYETQNAVYIHTNLIGPAKDENIRQTVTYPYIVVKLEEIDKNVVFD